MEQVAELVSEAEYLRTHYEPDAEFVDGVLEQRAMGEDDHSAWQMAICAFFAVRAVEWNIRVRPELRNKVADRRYRVPDIALLDFDVPKAPIAVVPPLTIFEVLSPEDRYKRLIVRLRDFAAMGVQNIFVVDPETGVFQKWFPHGLMDVEVVACRDHTASVKEIPALVR